MDTRIRMVGNQIVVTAAQVWAFLHTPAGRQVRRYVAVGLMITAPLLFRIPALRRSPLIRVLEAIGGAAVVIKLAEAIRDWERAAQPESDIVIDVA